MEFEKIKQLMDEMGNSKLSEIDIDFPDGTKISMKKEKEKQITVEKIVQSNNENNIKKENITDKTNKQDTNNENIKIVKSPMVGTFYIKPSPTSVQYVEKGKDVKKGDILCIIEAMKLMNEIESEYDGKITEIYVKDGQSIEYGQKLFAIE